MPTHFLISCLCLYIGPESPKVEDTFDTYQEMALEASKKQQMALKIAAKKVRWNIVCRIFDLFSTSSISYSILEILSSVFAATLY